MLSGAVGVVGSNARGEIDMRQQFGIEGGTGWACVYRIDLHNDRCD